MPVMSGLDSCKQIRTKYSLDQLPIIMVSAKNQPDHIVESFGKGGINDYMLKPVNKQELIARMQVHLHYKRLLDKYKRLLFKKQDFTDERRTPKDRIRDPFKSPKSPDIPVTISPNITTKSNPPLAILPAANPPIASPPPSNPLLSNHLPSNPTPVSSPLPGPPPSKSLPPNAIPTPNPLPSLPLPNSPPPNAIPVNTIPNPPPCNSFHGDIPPSNPLPSNSPINYTDPTNSLPSNLYPPTNPPSQTFSQPHHAHPSLPFYSISDDIRQQLKQTQMQLALTQTYLKTNCISVKFKMPHDPFFRTIFLQVLNIKILLYLLLT